MISVQNNKIGHAQKVQTTEFNTWVSRGHRHRETGNEFPPVTETTNIPKLLKTIVCLETAVAQRLKGTHPE